jgi:hypothetical protein
MGGSCGMHYVRLDDDQLFRGLHIDIRHSKKWPAVPDAIYSYPIRFKGSAVYFVQPWLGKYFDNDIWIGFGLLGLFFLLMWMHRDEVVRYD